MAAPGSTLPSPCPASRCEAWAGSSTPSGSLVQAWAEASRAWRTTGRNSPRAGIVPIAALRRPGRRRPCRCFRGRPCRIAIAGADARSRRWLVRAPVLVAVEALRVLVAASCSLAEAEPCTSASVGSRLELAASNRSSALVDRVRSRAADRMAETGMKVR